MKKSILLIQLKQALKQLKIKILIKNLNKQNLNLLKFLWQNNYIYGFNKFIIKQKSIYYYIFLKYSKQGNYLFVTKQNVNITKKNLLKIEKWSKNSLFILKANKKCFINQKQSLKHKIGGYLLYKIL